MVGSGLVRREDEKFYKEHGGAPGWYVNGKIRRSRISSRTLARSERGTKRAAIPSLGGTWEGKAGGKYMVTIISQNWPRRAGSGHSKGI